MAALERERTLSSLGKKLDNIGSSIGIYLQRHFNVSEDEITAEKIQEFYQIERDKLAENGLEFATEEEVKKDVEDLKRDLGIL